MIGKYLSKSKSLEVHELKVKWNKLLSNENYEVFPGYFYSGHFYDICTRWVGQARINKKFSV
jgi:hypothetical protein